MHGERPGARSLDGPFLATGDGAMSQADSVLDYAERPVFGDIEVTSLSFAFELFPSQIESLVEDVISLRRSYADRRTNNLLLGIAVLSILSILSISGDAQGGLGISFLDTLVGQIGLLFLAMAAMRGPTWIQERRSRNIEGTSPE